METKWFKYFEDWKLVKIPTYCSSYAWFYWFFFSLSRKESNLFSMQLRMLLFDFYEKKMFYYNSKYLVWFSKLKCHFHCIFVDLAFVGMCVRITPAKRKACWKNFNKNNVAKTGTKTLLWFWMEELKNKNLKQ